MASQEFVILEPLWATSGDRWFRTAYEWNRDQIYAWMKKTADPGDVKPGEQTVDTLLTYIYNRLISLSLPNGSIYQNINLRPRSHIARLVDRDWENNPKPPSKFIVNGWPIDGVWAPESSTQSSAARVPDWWCPYDLLGLFLGLLGPAPPAADKNNFYLPLTAVYGRWCARIAGRPDAKWKNWHPTITGEGNLPFVFQCTWHLEVDNSTKKHWGQYFLGASTAGDRFETRPESLNAYTGSAWRERVQEARFNMLYRCQNITMVQENDFRDKTAPNMKKANRNMVPYGNCAETYPFAIRFLGQEKNNKKSINGLALKKDFMQEAEYGEYDEFVDGKIWSNLMAPCDNCKVLIGKAGAKNSQFAWNLDRSKAPTKSRG